MRPSMYLEKHEFHPVKDDLITFISFSLGFLQSTSLEYPSLAHVSSGLYSNNHMVFLWALDCDKYIAFGDDLQFNKQNQHRSTGINQQFYIIELISLHNTIYQIPCVLIMHSFYSALDQLYIRYNVQRYLI